MPANPIPSSNSNVYEFSIYGVESGTVYLYK